MEKRPLVVAITGASGSLYAVRLLEVLLRSKREVHLVMSPSGAQVLETERHRAVDLKQFSPEAFFPEIFSTGDSEMQTDADQLFYHHYMNFSAGIASGSFLTDGMGICPCSMGTLSGVAHGLSSNVIHRAADVHLKEKRKLILVPRETPLSSVQLENMKRCVDSGAVMLPAMPAFYQGPETISDMVDFVVGRICDQLGVPNTLFARWGSRS